MRRFIHRLLNTFLHDRAEVDLAREMAAHLTILEDEHRRRGMTADEARLAARRAMHGVEQAKERHRDARSFRWLDDLRQDLHYALRTLRRLPGFAVVAVVTLAVGIGADTAVFSVVDGVLLKPLPYPEPDRLVRLYDVGTSTGLWPVSPGNFHEFRTRVSGLEAAAAYQRRDLQLAGDPPVELRGMAVTSNFFTLLGWAPELGRDFGLDDERPGQGDAVILSHDVWERRFGSDRSILGRPITLSGRAFQVVGVLAPGFQHVGGAYRSYAHGDAVDVWTPQAIQPEPRPSDRQQHYLNAVGRLRAGVSPEQARAALKAAAAALAAEHPETNGTWTADLMPLMAEITGGVRPTLVGLLVAVQIVLLLACANVAGLLLGRATSRTREIGVRAALGASRWRLVRQLGVESAVLAGLGGAVGILLASGAVDLLAAFGPESVPRLQSIRIDGGILLYSLAAALATAVVFGLAPAVHLARTNVDASLREGGRVTTGAAPHRVRRMLVVAEIALAVGLVASAGLLLRSFVTLSNLDPGFTPRGVLTARINVPAARYPDQASALSLYDRLRERVAALPGVVAIGIGSDLPWTGYDENTGFDIVGRTFPPNAGPEARYHFVTPDYFASLGVPVAAGRAVSTADRADAAPVVLINDAAARRYWSGADPLRSAVGSQLDLWGKTRNVVGVVGSVRDAPWSDTAVPALYFPVAQQSNGQDMFLAVRTAGPPTSLAAPLRAIVHDLDPALPLADVRTLDDVADAAFAVRRFVLMLVGAFGFAALFLATVGVYGVMAQLVGQRRQEFGVRQAFGATPRDILRLVVAHGCRLGVIGVVGGLGFAFLTARLFASLLFGVRVTDPLTFGAVAALILATSVLASYLPARRATKVDPMVALRCE